MATKKRTFEQAPDLLNDIVAQMERPETGLEECLKLYKEGVELSVFCGERLNTVEKEVTMLSKRAEEGIVQTPFTIE